MKQTIYFVVLLTVAVIVPLACNNDSDPASAHELLLTKIGRDGVTLLELEYSNERKLARSDYYEEGELAIYTLYEYDHVGIHEIRQYSGNDHGLTVRIVVTLDNFGRISKAEYYTSDSDFKEVYSEDTFGYDASGLLISKQRREIGEPVYYREEFSYDAGKNLTRTQRIRHPNQPEEFLNFQADFTADEKTIPTHWADYIVLLSITNYDDLVRGMFNVRVRETYWVTQSTLDADYQWDATERQFDPDGYLTRQVLTATNLRKNTAGNPYEMIYEYAE